MSLAAIHILRKELGLTESEYRAILREVAGVDSAKYLDESGDRAVMARLYAIRDQRREAAKCRVKSPAERKIWALWLGGDDRPGLRNYLPAQDRTANYLLGFVRRASGNTAITKVSDLSTLTGKEAYRTIEALKLRLEHEREKVAQEVPF